MSSVLPIDIDRLLRGDVVESVRVELKASWDASTTGYQVLKTICAFANDLQELNGGYIVLGVAERDGRALLPPKGLDPGQLDEIQKWIRGNCNRLDPQYQPVLSPESYEGQLLLAIWVQPSVVRPHKAPDGDKAPSKFWVRLGSETVDAEKNGVLRQLLELNARIPFDDRPNREARVEDLRETRLREFLHDVESSLLNEPEALKIYHQMGLLWPINAHAVPRNIGLLFFAERPDTWFRGAWIEIVEFADDEGGNVQGEHFFRGPLHDQLRQALRYLENLIPSHLEKLPDRAAARGWAGYPVPALRESLANAIYHRSYDADMVEPTKVYLYPNRVEITSYPGPVPGITIEHLRGKARMPQVGSRNRRIGEYLKELRLAEGRFTGIPKIRGAMEKNGSPEPEFDFDEGRTYFRVTLPAHPEYVAIGALRDSAYLRGIGDDRGALERLRSAWQQNQGSAALANELIRELATRGSLSEARQTFEAFLATSPRQAARVITTLADAYIGAGRPQDATRILDHLPDALLPSEAIEAAIAERRARREDRAHRLFLKAGDALYSDVRGLHEFAQTKMRLTSPNRGHVTPEGRRRLLQEARELLEQVVSMDAGAGRHAWAYYDLAQVKRWLKQPTSEIKADLERAIRLDPYEPRFRLELERLR